MGERRNVLIVYAHQEPKSFNGALKDVAVNTLEAEGHKVTVSDLYEMKFDPTASKEQFKELKSPEHFQFQAELSHAASSNNLPDDTREEVRKILDADLIILQCPMYWLGIPAILKGWMERCFADGVAFDTVNFGWFDNGPFKDKKIILSMTTGGMPSFFTSKGIFGDIDVHLFPVQVIGVTFALVTALPAYIIILLRLTTASSNRSQNLANLMLIYGFLLRFEVIAQHRKKLKFLDLSKKKKKK